MNNSVVQNRIDSVTKTQATFIKWLGFFTMLVDHVVYFFFQTSPYSDWFHMVGRLAFPCFLFGVISGLKWTRNKRSYIMRLFVLGVISIPVAIIPINVLFTLGLLAVSIAYKDKGSGFLIVLCFVLSALTEYNVYGFIFGWLLYGYLLETKHFSQRSLFYWIGFLSLHVVMIQVIGWIQLFALLFLVVFEMLTRIEFKTYSIEQSSFMKWFGYVFYPLHLLVLSLL